MGPALFQTGKAEDWRDVDESERRYTSILSVGARNLNALFPEECLEDPCSEAHKHATLRPAREQPRRGNYQGERWNVGAEDQI